MTLKSNKRERLDKILSLSGYGSRKEVKKIIRDGLVTVNNSTINDPGFHVILENDKVKVAGVPVHYKEFIYIMLNKPQGVVSSTRDYTNTTVLDLLEGEYSHRDLFPVGRLDKDTEGLILLTDNGKLAHSLLSPKNQIPKTYYVEVKGKLKNDDIKAFKKGIDLGDFTTMPAEMEILEVGNEHSKAKLKIYEGKFHQVKRMMEAIDTQVTYLKRVSIGPLILDEDLLPGMWRELNKKEIQDLHDATKK